MKWIVIIVGVIIILVVSIMVLRWKSASMVVEIGNESYDTGESMMVLIVNKLWNKELCLSSCYPYFLERRDDSWGRYWYEECDTKDKVAVCIGPREEKMFETSVPEIGQGEYRLVVPVCKNCNVGTVFYEEETFPSGSFHVR